MFGAISNHSGGLLRGQYFTPLPRRATHRRRSRLVEAEREVLAEQLGRVDVDLPYVIIGKRKHHRVLRSRACYTSAVGPLEVERTLYRVGL